MRLEFRKSCLETRKYFAPRKFGAVRFKICARDVSRDPVRPSTSARRGLLDMMRMRIPGNGGVVRYSSLCVLTPDESEKKHEKRVPVHTTVDSVVEGTEQFSAVLTSTDDRVTVTVTEERADISILETGNGNIYG